MIQSSPRQAAVTQSETWLSKLIEQLYAFQVFPILNLARACALSLLLWLIAASPALAADGFVLCGEDCSELSADTSNEAYFVGYGRGQHLELAGEVIDFPNRKLKIYPHVTDFQSQENTPNVDEQHLNVGAKEAISVHRIDDVRIGFLKKSEDLSLPGLSPEAQRSGKINATSELVWGDTLRISSTRLSEGSPVALQIEREMGGGFGKPATDYANYRLISQTWVNGHLVPKLDYQLAKYPGPGEADREQGSGKAAASVLVKVGDAVTVESRLQVKDGVVASDDPQILDGNDSVTYRLALLSDDSCATSDSGLLTVGDCDPT